MNIKNLYDRVMKANTERNQIAKEIVRLNDEDKFEEALGLQAKLDAANKEYDGANSLYLSTLAATSGGTDPAQRFIPMGGQTETQEIKDLRASPQYMQEWLNAFRIGATPKTVKGGMHSAEQFPMLINALTETGGSPTGEEGGFLNPVDFDNRIHELMRNYVDLANYVNVEDVTTLTGWRVIEQFAAALPLTKVTELAIKEDDEEGESPLFSKVDYTLDEYFDFLRVGNSLMQDTPVNLMNYLSRWFSRKVILTHNDLILTLIDAITGTAVTDYKTGLGAIKTALNKTLDPAFSASATIFTNQSGLDVLDQLDDGTGRPLLQPDPSLSTAFRVKGRPVVVVSDAHWANMSGPARARIAIGDGREYMTLFRRNAFEFASTNIGGASWRSNSTEVRGIARFDAQELDADAMAVLKVTLPS
jgi:HK97 family phage major capsid protein